MGTTFVNIGERGFWMRDGILELWLRLLSLHLPEPTSQDRTTSRLLPIRDRWLLASRGYFNGCVPVDLAEAVGDAEGRQVVVEGIRSLLDALAHAPPSLDAATLNLLGGEGRWTSDIETRALTEVGAAFLDLIEGRIDSGAADTSFMPGNKMHR